ncbi:MAG: spore coat U domain-containing protein [Burkholderiaceae bacterium]
MKALLRALLLTAGLLCAQQAHALCTLVWACVVSTTPMVFTAHNPLVAANNDITAKVRVDCGGIVGLAIPYSVAFSAGTSGSMAARQMASGTKRLAYNLYTTTGRTTVWGDGSGSTATVGGGFLLDLLGLAPPQELTIFGRIPGSQTGVAPGSYADTLVVTLTYY